MTCVQLRTKTRTSISRKICGIKLGFQILHAVEQFSSLFLTEKLKQGAHIHQTHDPPCPRCRVRTAVWFPANSSHVCEFQVNPQNPVKFTKMCKIPRNSREILSNTCQYNIFETYLGYWGCLIAKNLQIYLETSSPQCANDIPKLPGVNYVVKNWTLVMMLKALPLAHFSSALLLKYYVRLSLLKTLNMLIKSAQNQSISSKICPENSHKIGCFYRLFFIKVSRENFCQICL